ncbi:MAG: PVC-type heme-binding CxxCH protein, partial [Gemmataceae bacterium]
MRVHVQRILSERPKLTPAQHDLALAALKDADANVQRAAADALGRHPNAEKNLRPLLALRHAVPKDDTHLLHVVRMSLRDQLLTETNIRWMSHKEWSERDHRAIADVCLGVPSLQAASYLLGHLQKYSVRGELLTSLVHHAARHGNDNLTNELIQFARGKGADDLAQQTNLFHAIEHGLQERRAPLPEQARAWAGELTGRLLASKKAGDVASGIKLVGDLRLTDQQKRLAVMAAARGVAESQRKAAVEALMKLDARGNAAVLGRVLADADAPIGVREQCITLLAQANQPQTRAELLRSLPTAPARLQKSIAVGLAASRDGAEKLLEAVKTGKASARLLQDPAVRPRLQASRLPHWKERIAELTTGLPLAGKDM